MGGLRFVGRAGTVGLVWSNWRAGGWDRSCSRVAYRSDPEYRSGHHPFEPRLRNYQASHSRHHSCDQAWRSVLACAARAADAHSFTNNRTSVYADSPSTPDFGGNRNGGQRISLLAGSCGFWTEVQAADSALAGSTIFS